VSAIHFTNEGFGVLQVKGAVCTFGEKNNPCEAYGGSVRHILAKKQEAE
jgi:hypothetical protein